MAAGVQCYSGHCTVETSVGKQGSRSARLSPQSMTILRVHVQQCASSDSVKVDIPIEKAVC